MELPKELHSITDAFPFPLVFATVSGAHLYGFPSPDSDFDLRGCFVLPARQVLGLRDPEETEERLGPESGLDLDLVAHDVRKFCRMLLTRNGYVLEQLLSPHVVVSSPEHEEMRALVPAMVTRHHAHHYLGFARGQWRLFTAKPRVKTLLYVYRVLLTGIHLMKSGKLCAALPDLLAEYPQAGVEELLASKRAGAEKQAAGDAAVEVHTAAYERLLTELGAARDSSQLPERPTCLDQLDDLVIRLRLQSL